MKPSVALLVFSCLSCGNGERISPASSGGAGGEGGASGASCDQDRDGQDAVTCGGDDCDDARPDIFPGADDVCDGDDNDCDEIIDQDNACDCAEPPPEPEIEFSERVCMTGGWLDMGMGATDPQAAHIAFIAVPVHRVFVSPFYLDAYEVTNRRFIACLDDGACEIEEPPPVPSAAWSRTEYSTEDQLDRPYWGASAQGAETFCEWAGGWLPSEAQWERAAAGLGRTTESSEKDGPRPFPHGGEPSTCEQEWTRDCLPPDASLPTAERVGQLLPNPEGIYDLGGNVAEWTADLFSMVAYEACPAPCKNPCFGCADKTAGNPLLAPDEAPWPWGHAMRGGVISISKSRAENLVFARSQYRDRGIGKGADNPVSIAFNHGFRCAYPAMPRQ
ncbi:MAG TPA: formylglycine-generating enzyme family protein [Polyangiaceae bacterium]|nr:formylglycine-generating enzyme family protein [Polyangiaceae bacterium]